MPPSTNGFVTSGQQAGLHKNPVPVTPELIELYKRVRGPSAEPAFAINWYRSTQEKVEKLIYEFKPTIFCTKVK